METQNIQVTLTLTPEQLPALMALLNVQTSPAPMHQQQTPAPQNPPSFAPQTAAPAPAPQNLGQMFPAMPTAAPGPMPQQTPMPTMPQAQPMQPQQSIQQNPMLTAPPPVMPTQTPPVQQAPVPMPTAQPQTYSVQDLGLAARPLVESGRREELVALLTEFGVPSVAAIPEDRRADFAARLRALGGQI